jgi:hypothetical protein
MSSSDVNKNVIRNSSGTWTYRRQIINRTLLFCAACVLYLMFFGSDNSEQLQIQHSF